MAGSQTTQLSSETVLLAAVEMSPATLQCIIVRFFTGLAFLYVIFLKRFFRKVAFFSVSATQMSNPL